MTEGGRSRFGSLSSSAGWEMALSPGLLPKAASDQCGPSDPARLSQRTLAPAETFPLTTPVLRKLTNSDEREKNQQMFKADRNRTGPDRTLMLGGVRSGPEHLRPGDVALLAGFLVSHPERRLHVLLQNRDPAAPPDPVHAKTGRSVQSRACFELD